jgi:hypothetical protein
MWKEVVVTEVNLASLGGDEENKTLLVPIRREC